MTYVSLSVLFTLTCLYVSSGFLNDPIQLGILFCNQSDNSWSYNWRVWWLIFGVNLTGLRDTQIAGTALSLRMSLSVFLVEVSIWISELSEEGRCILTHAGWAPSNQVNSSTEQTSRGKANSLPLLKLGQPSSPAHGHQHSRLSSHWTPGPALVAPQVLRPLLCHQLPWFSSLQTANHRTSQPP